MQNYGHLSSCYTLIRDDSPTKKVLDLVNHHPSSMHTLLIILVVHPRLCNSPALDCEILATIDKRIARPSGASLQPSLCLYSSLVLIAQPWSSLPCGLCLGMWQLPSSIVSCQNMFSCSTLWMDLGIVWRYGYGLRSIILFQDFYLDWSNEICVYEGQCMD